MKLFKFMAVAAAICLIAVPVSAADAQGCYLPAEDPMPIEREAEDFPVRAFSAEDGSGRFTDTYPVDENGYTKGLVTSYSGDYRFKMEINGNTLTVQGHTVLPDGFRPYFVSVGGTTKYISSQDFTENFDLSSMSDGTIAVYYAYRVSSYYYRPDITDATLEKKDGDLHFVVNNDVYRKNDWFINGNFRLPVYFLYEDGDDWIVVNDKVKGWAEEITAGAVTDYEKIKAVHDWAAANIYYDNATLKQSSINDTNLNAIDVYEKTDGGKRYAVCHGYSNLCASLLRSIGIPCKVAVGWGVVTGATWNGVTDTSRNHAWNEAWCAEENRWILFDATWDSPNSRNLDGDTVVYSSDERMPQYFDLSPKQYACDHLIVTYSQIWDYYYNMIGDINYDGACDNTDSKLFVKYFTGLYSPASYYVNYYKQYVLDVNGDQKTDFLDAIAQQKKIIFQANVNSQAKT